MVGRLTGSGLLAFSLFLNACSSTGPRPASPAVAAGEIVQLNIITSPVGLDIDGRPGLDGFSAKIFANSQNSPKPVPIRSGTLEIVMFDGTLYGRTNIPPPLATWTFTLEQLRMVEFTARIGTGYDFVLPWGRQRPAQKMITIGARYTSPQGRVLTSSLSSVTVLD